MHMQGVRAGTHGGEEGWNAHTVSVAHAGVSAGTHSGRAVSVGERATGKDVMAGIAGIPAQLEREGEIIQLYV